MKAFRDRLAVEKKVLWLLPYLIRSYVTLFLIREQSLLIKDINGLKFLTLKHFEGGSTTC